MRCGAVASFLLSTAVLATACGGESQLSREELTSEADAICAGANERVRALAPVPREFGPELNRDVGALRTIVRDALNDLRELDPPEDAAPSMRRMLSRLAQAHATLGRVTRAARSRDERAFLAAESEYISVLAGPGRVARRLGLRECERLGFP